MEELRTFPCLSHEGFESGLTTHNFFLDLLGREVVDIRMGVSKIPAIEPGSTPINLPTGKRQVNLTALGTNLPLKCATLAGGA